MAQRCKKCMMSEGKFGVTLDDDGYCNYCDYFRTNKTNILDTNQEQLFIDRINQVKGKYPYDCMVGLSGGKDSTFVLYQMVKKYNLKVLAVTYDNGFMSDFSKASIERTLKQLNVDYYFYKPNWEVHKQFYRITINKLGDPCIACAFGGYFLAMKACFDKRIPFFIHGRSPYQMYRNYYPGSNDMFLPMMAINLQPHSFSSITEIYRLIHQKMKQIIHLLADDQSLANEIIGEFIADETLFKEEFAPEFLSYFIYHPYDEEDMKQVLIQNIGWQRPEDDHLLGHQDCKIHHASGQMYQFLNGVNVLEPDVASMLRFEALTPAKAQELLDIRPDETILQKSVKELCTVLGYEESDLTKHLSLLREQGISKFESR